MAHNVTNMDRYRQHSWTDADNSPEAPPKVTRTWEQKLAAFDSWFTGLSRQQQGQIRSVVNDPSMLPDLDVKARAVLEFLNERRRQAGLGGRGFRPAEAHLRMIRARLADGIDVSDLRAIVVVKCRQAASGDFDPQYLRPATLFNATKCENYLGELGEVGL